jgi:hypothetical protein
MRVSQPLIPRCDADEVSPALDVVDEDVGVEAAPVT